MAIGIIDISNFLEREQKWILGSALGRSPAPGCLPLVERTATVKPQTSVTQARSVNKSAFLSLVTYKMLSLDKYKSTRIHKLQCFRYLFSHAYFGGTYINTYSLYSSLCIQVNFDFHFLFLYCLVSHLVCCLSCCVIFYSV